jgi:putative glutamine amidotransferase
MRTIAIPLSNEGSKTSINTAYLNLLLGAKFVPMPLFQSMSEVDTEEIFAHCDGLLLPGGIDLDPIYYGENNWASQSVDPEKDAFERRLFWLAVNKGKPTFGICRGLQLIAREFISANYAEVSRDLTFGQHIADHTRNSSLSIARTVPTHFVEVFNKFLYGDKEEKVAFKAVNSMHHQYLHCVTPEKQVRRRPLVCDRLIVTAWTREGLAAKEAGVVVEGFVIPGWKTAAVQWHPEELSDFKLLQHFFHRGANENYIFANGDVGA